MKPDRIQDLRQFEDKIYEAVQKCHAEAVENSAVGLYVCPLDCDVLVVPNPQAEAEALFGYECVDWQSLVTADGSPDVDAINEVASGYVFVR